MVLSATLVTIVSHTAFAQYGRTDGIVTRDEFQKHLREHNDEKNSLFGSAPVYHIIPTPNNVTFAIEATNQNLLVGPDGLDVSDHSGEALDHKLEAVGKTFRPFVAFSSRKFGLGFSAEVGERTIKYLRRPYAADINYTSTQFGYEEHFSTLTYSGIGGYLFVNLSLKMLPKYVQPTVILGIDQFAVKHSSIGRRTSQFDDAPPSLKYTYNVKRTHAGANIGITLMRKFVLRPWFDVSNVELGTPKDGDASIDDPGAAGLADITKATAEDADAIVQDQELVWDTEPDRRYGLDFAVNIGKLSINLGGLMGLLGSVAKGSNRVNDSSLNVSIAYSLKGFK